MLIREKLIPREKKSSENLLLIIDFPLCRFKSKGSFRTYLRLSLLTSRKAAFGLLINGNPRQKERKVSKLQKIFLAKYINFSNLPIRESFFLFDMNFPGNPPTTVMIDAFIGSSIRCAVSLPLSAIKIVDGTLMTPNIQGK